MQIYNSLVFFLFVSEDVFLFLFTARMAVAQDTILQRLKHKFKTNYLRFFAAYYHQQRDFRCHKNRHQSWSIEKFSALKTWKDFLFFVIHVGVLFFFAQHNETTNDVAHAMKQATNK